MLYRVEVINYNDVLSFRFIRQEKFRSMEDGGEYAITIQDGQVRHWRRVYRPNHDHHDSGYLAVLKELEERHPTPNSALIWTESMPREDGKTEWPNIPFGSIKVGY